MLDVIRTSMKGQVQLCPLVGAHRRLFLCQQLSGRFHLHGGIGPRRCRRWGHAISAFTEVICAVILSVRAASLFLSHTYNPPLWPCVRVFRIVCLVWVPMGYRGCSTRVKLAQRGQHSDVTAGRGPPMAFLGQQSSGVCLHRGIGSCWCQCGGLACDSGLHGEPCFAVRCNPCHLIASTENHFSV